MPEIVYDVAYSFEDFSAGVLVIFPQMRSHD